MALRPAPLLPRVARAADRPMPSLFGAAGLASLMGHRGLRALSNPDEKHRRAAAATRAGRQLPAVRQPHLASPQRSAASALRTCAGNLRSTAVGPPLSDAPARPHPRRGRDDAAAP